MWIDRKQSIGGQIRPFPDDNIAELPPEEELCQYQLGLCKTQFLQQGYYGSTLWKIRQMCSVWVEIGAFLSNRHCSDTPGTN